MTRPDLSLSPALEDGTELGDAETLSAHFQSPGSALSPVVSMDARVGPVRALARLPAALVERDPDHARRWAAAAFQVQFTFRNDLDPESPLSWGFRSQAVLGWLAYQETGAHPWIQPVLTSPDPGDTGDWARVGFAGDPSALVAQFFRGVPLPGYRVAPVTPGGLSWVGRYRHACAALGVTLSAVAVGMPGPGGTVPTVKTPAGAPWPVAPPFGGPAPAPPSPEDLGDNVVKLNWGDQ